MLLHCDGWRGAHERGDGEGFVPALERLIPFAHPAVGPSICFSSSFHSGGMTMVRDFKFEYRGTERRLHFEFTGPATGDVPSADGIGAWRVNAGPGDVRVCDYRWGDEMDPRRVAEVMRLALRTIDGIEALASRPRAI
jgi:hypothetical protein